MKKLIYLYTDPFTTRSATFSDYGLDYLSDADKQDQEKIHALFLRFALEQKIVEVKDSLIVPSAEENMGSLIWIVNWMNFRSLVGASKLTMVLSALQADNQHPLNQIIDLHSRLGVLFDPQLLNTIVHRTLSSVSLIPYAISPDDTRVSWEEIHTETPFLWVIILLQAVLRSTINPL